MGEQVDGWTGWWKGEWKDGQKCLPNYTVIINSVTMLQDY